MITKKNNAYSKYSLIDKGVISHFNDFTHYSNIDLTQLIPYCKVYAVDVDYNNREVNLRKGGDTLSLLKKDTLTQIQSGNKFKSFIGVESLKINTFDVEHITIEGELVIKIGCMEDLTKLSPYISIFMEGKTTESNLGGFLLIEYGWSGKTTPLKQLTVDKINSFYKDNNGWGNAILTNIKGIDLTLNDDYTFNVTLTLVKSDYLTGIDSNSFVIAYVSSENRAKYDDFLRSRIWPYKIKDPAYEDTIYGYSSDGESIPMITIQDFISAVENYLLSSNNIFGNEKIVNIKFDKDERYMSTDDEIPLNLSDRTLYKHNNRIIPLILIPYNLTRIDKTNITITEFIQNVFDKLTEGNLINLKIYRHPDKIDYTIIVPEENYEIYSPLKKEDIITFNIKKPSIIKEFDANMKVTSDFSYLIYKSPHDISNKYWIPPQDVKEIIKRYPQVFNAIKRRAGELVLEDIDDRLEKSAVNVFQGSLEIDSILEVARGTKEEKILLKEIKKRNYIPSWLRYLNPQGSISLFGISGFYPLNLIKITGYAKEIGFYNGLYGITNVSDSISPGEWTTTLEYIKNCSYDEEEQYKQEIRRKGTESEFSKGMKEHPEWFKESSEPYDMKHFTESD